MPIYYKAELRAKIYEVKENYQQEHCESRPRAGIASNFVENMRAVKERIDDKWREEWSSYRNDNWTKKLRGDACTFKKCKKKY